MLLHVSAPSAQICQHVLVKDSKENNCFQGVMEFITFGRARKTRPLSLSPHNGNGKSLQLTQRLHTNP